jgi:Raf kinase inhibitor-like YbhB/YbcL family protein
MELGSSSFAANQEIPRRYGKRAENISPQLSWRDPPEGTRSFALAMVDTHPIARGYVHWLVADIPANVSALNEGAAAGGMPAGSRELTPYAGPFPPSGTHDYEFTLYALDTAKLDMPDDASLRRFTEAAERHALATAKLVGRFTRA